jgi:hypothetical protein
MPTFTAILTGTPQIFFGLRYAWLPTGNENTSQGRMLTLWQVERNPATEDDNRTLSGCKPVPVQFRFAAALRGLL